MLSSVFGVIRSRLPEARAQIVMGIAFGLVAMFQMNAPLNMMPGVIVDMRNVPVALAGAFLGWRAALVCLIMAASMRGYIGGVGMPSGIVAMGIACLAGQLWNYWTRRQSRRGIAALLLLSVMVSSHLAAAVLMPWEASAVFLSTMALPMAALNILSIPVAATFLEHERMRALAESRRNAEREVHPVSGLARFDVFSRDALALAHSDAHVSIAGINVIRLTGRDHLAGSLGGARFNLLLGAMRVRLQSQDCTGLPVAITEDGRIVTGLNFQQVADPATTEALMRRLLNDQAYQIDGDLHLRVSVSVQTYHAPTLARLQDCIEGISVPAPKWRPLLMADQEPSQEHRAPLAARTPRNSDRGQRQDHLFETAQVLWTMKQG
ncbi:MAG TPA: LytS/YhcK type 5TM receptor domain-containing protein [Roseovarius sp.]